MTGDLYRIPDGTPGPAEYTETLYQNASIVLERIISHGHTSAPGEWYDQEKDEWVALLQGDAALRFDDGAVLELRAGDWTFIAAHRRHRVERTSIEPPCIWLALHIPSHPR